jgi:hypothetical protein
VTGKPEHLQELQQRLDAAMEPLPDASRSPPPVPESAGLQAAEPTSVP